MADSGKREDWRARASRAEALLAEAVPMRVFEAAKAEADDKEREAAMARRNEGVNREHAERAEARLAEALNLLGEAVGFVGVRQPLDYDSEVEADQVRIRVENFLSREVEPE